MTMFVAYLIGWWLNNPQRTIIAAEAERGPTLPNIHEADAAEVHPRDAEAVMERIVAERDQAIKDHPPNVAAEIEPKRPHPVAEGGEGEGGARPVGADRGGPVFQSGGGARGAAGGEEQPSGGDGGREGAKLAGSQLDQQEAQMSEQQTLARALGMPSLPSQLQSGSVQNPDLPTEPGTSS